MAEKKSKLAEIKTKQTSQSVEGFINMVKEDQKRTDSFVLLELMKKESGEDAKMWGTSIIGFGNKRYKSPTSGREVDWFLKGISFIDKQAVVSLFLLTNTYSEFEYYNPLKLKESQF